MQRNLCLLCCVKNESMVISEFIDHYVEEGFDSFIFVDNGSTDDTPSKIQTIFQKYPECFYEIRFMPKKNAQVELLNQVFQEVRSKYTYMALFDADEYIYSVDPKYNSKQVINQIFSENPNVDSIEVPWICFGSSGHEKQPDSIRKSFVLCRKKPDVARDWQKSIVRCKNTISIDIHKCHVKGRKLLASDTRKYLKINHQKIMSWEQFSQVKATRGDVHSKKWDQLRDQNFFKKFDFTDEIDIVLQTRVLAKERNMCSRL